MDELNALLKPSWGAEKWILEGWNKINEDEKAVIKERMHDLFKDGLPLDIKYDKLLYIYTFALLAQFEVLAIQVPLRFEDKMSTPEFRQSMRAQLLDEIFHGLVFTKILYLLCAPYNSPPEYNEHIEALCDFVRNEECPKVGVVLLNLVAEGWIEEIFKSLYQQNIAPKVFKVILEDEHRHVCEADLYRDIGLPDEEVLIKKLRTLENLLMTSLSMQPKYAMSVNVLLGPHAAAGFLRSLDAKHTRQLKKINLAPSEEWQLFVQMGQEVFEELEGYTEEVDSEARQELYEIDMSSIRKAFMTQWNNPGDPMMVSQFNIDVSRLDFFGKKYPPETLTTLMMQTVSHLIAQDPSYRRFLSYNKMYETRSAYVSVVVKLPGCGDHMGNIVFKDCHEMPAQQLGLKIKRAVQMMVYCYTKREQVENKHPDLKHTLDEMLYGYAHDIYPYPTSNIGFCGYSQAVSPLRKHEGQKVTLLMVERKPVWNQVTQSFEARDLLPVSISADHRVFDGNLPIPKMMSKSFNLVFEQMLQDIAGSEAAETESSRPNYKKIADKMLANDFDVVAEKMRHSANTKKIVRKMMAEDVEYKGEKITKDSDFKGMADEALREYLDFNAEKALNDLDIAKIVDKLLSENMEMGYRLLATLQNVWLDFVDLEEVYSAVSKKMAQSKLNEWARVL